MRKDRPSRTAYKVAINLVTLSAKPGMEAILPKGAVEATAQLLVASGAARERTVQWARSPRMVSVYEWFDWILPGQFEAFAHRKAFCENQSRQGIANGARQILVLGAGYDTMGWRLAPEFPDVRFFEIDHPATARIKARGIESLGARDNLVLLAEDLGERSLRTVLESDARWEPRAQTVLVAEGLVMYLPAEAVRDLFRRSAAVTGRGSRIAFSYIPGETDGRLDVGRWTGLMLWLQKLAGEPWLWSIPPEELGEFLERAGWRESPELIGMDAKHGVEFFAVATRA